MKILHVTKKLYFYKFLFSVSMLAMAIVLISKKNFLASSLDFDTLYGLLTLLGTLYSLPVLIYALGTKLHHNVAVIGGGISAFVLLVVFLVSINKAVETVENVKNALQPVLGLFFVCSASLLIINIWKEKR